jgi:hypothetical protein
VADVVFKPANGYKTIVKSSYPHPDKPDYVPKEKNYKDADGKVRTDPPNIVTNPKAKNLFKFREHKTD